MGGSNLMMALLCSLSMKNLAWKPSTRSSCRGEVSTRSLPGDAGGAIGAPAGGDSADVCGKSSPGPPTVIPGLFGLRAICKRPAPGGDSRNRTRGR